MPTADRFSRVPHAYSKPERYNLKKKKWRSSVKRYRTRFDRCMLRARGFFRTLNSPSSLINARKKFISSVQSAPDNKIEKLAEKFPLIFVGSRQSTRCLFYSSFFFFLFNKLFLLKIVAMSRHAITANVCRCSRERSVWLCESRVPFERAVFKHCLKNFARVSASQKRRKGKKEEKKKRKEKQRECMNGH